MRAKSLLSIISFTVILIILIILCGDYMRAKDCTLDALYAVPDDTVDTIIVGSSHVYCGYVPAVLWNEYGISAFNIYGWSMPMRTAYAYIKETLKTQNLKVVMLDAATVCYGFGLNTSEVDEMNFNGNINFRMSVNRISLMLKDVYESINKRTLGEINDMTKYHNNWKSPELFNQTTDPSRFFLRNFGALYTELDHEPFLLNFYQEREAPRKEVQKYIQKLEALAQNEGFDLVFVLTPCDMQKEEMWVINWLTDYCNEKNIPFLNFMAQDNPAGFDYQYDMADLDHANYKGAIKLTRYIGNFLKENYVFPDSSLNRDKERIDTDARMVRKMLRMSEVMRSDSQLTDIMSWVEENKETLNICGATSVGTLSYVSDWLNINGLEFVASGGIFSVDGPKCNCLISGAGEYSEVFADDKYTFSTNDKGTVKLVMNNNELFTINDGTAFLVYDHDFKKMTYLVKIIPEGLIVEEMSVFLRGVAE